MRKYMYTMLAVAMIGFAACSSSPENNADAADSTITDTATFNTSSTDSLNMVDSAVAESTDGTEVDSSTIKPAP